LGFGDLGHMNTKTMSFHMGRQEMEEVHYVPRETFQLLIGITLVEWKSLPCITSSPSRGTSRTQVLLSKLHKILCKPSYSLWILGGRHNGPQLCVRTHPWNLLKFCHNFIFYDHFQGLQFCKLIINGYYKAW
jgi:hypothetical protein